ncbi:MAG TPA: hypothetical protein VE261_02280, partial [Gaiellaceae bacterium]|nr:hypothetical protein [Gaiellaceae bacterium]
VCKSLAFGELRRRHKEIDPLLPEKRLERALLNAFDTVDYTIGLDEKAGALAEGDATTMRNRERQETAWLLAELRELERRYPNPPRMPKQRRRLRINPRFRRFVTRGRTIPLQRMAA